MLNDMVTASPRREKVSRSVLSCLDEDIHPDAYYFSRLLQWPHLREGRETVASLMIPRTPAKSYYIAGAYAEWSYNNNGYNVYNMLSYASTDIWFNIIIDERQSNYLNLPQHIYQFGFHGRALLGREFFSSITNRSASPSQHLGNWSFLLLYCNNSGTKKIRERGRT